MLNDSFFVEASTGTIRSNWAVLNIHSNATSIPFEPDPGMGRIDAMGLDRHTADGAGAMREQGRIVDWNDARGFGFVEPHGGGERAFVHVSMLASGVRRPSTGDLVTYSLARDSNGRWQAHDVRTVGKRSAAAGSVENVNLSPWERWFLMVFAVALFAAVVRGAVPIVLPGIVLVMSVVTFIAYGLDKSASRRGSRRTSEATLHLLALLGGWPGALIAQRRFRHKTRKSEFRVVFWTTVGLNTVLLIGFAYWL